MGDDAARSEESAAGESEARSSDRRPTDDSTTTVRRRSEVPAAKGHGSDATPDALGIDRTAEQRRKRREESLGPGTVRRRERRGEVDREPTAFQRKAADLAGRIADDDRAGVDRSADGPGGDPKSVQRSVESETGAGDEDAGTDPASLVERVVSSPGRALDPGIRGEMESKMGTDFGDVRVHTGTEAARAARAIDARAFAVGNHVGFDHGEFDTSSPAGRHTIAHELAHVEQQANQAQRMARRVQEGSGVAVSDPGDPHEREAERVARRVTAGQEARVGRSSGTVDAARSDAPGTLRVDRLPAPSDLAETLDREAIQGILGDAVTRDVALKAIKVGLTGGAAASSAALGGAPLAVAAAGGGLAMTGEVGKMAAGEMEGGSGVSRGDLESLKHRVRDNENQLAMITERIGGGSGQTGMDESLGKAHSRQ